MRAVTAHHGAVARNQAPVSTACRMFCACIFVLLATPAAQAASANEVFEKWPAPTRAESIQLDLYPA
jgi:hypothetical protein